MQLLDGYKSGDRLLMLTEGREIERDNLWAIRVLLAMVFVNAAVQSPSASGPSWAVGLLLALGGLYWAALRLFSRSASDQEERTKNASRT